MATFCDSHFTDRITDVRRSLYSGSWSQLITGRLVPFHEFCELVNITVVAWKWPWWEYLPNGNQQVLQIRVLCCSWRTSCYIFTGTVLFKSQHGVVNHRDEACVGSWELSPSSSRTGFLSLCVKWHVKWCRKLTSSLQYFPKRENSPPQRSSHPSSTVISPHRNLSKQRVQMVTCIDKASDFLPAPFTEVLVIITMNKFPVPELK